MPAGNFFPALITYMAVNPLQSPNATTLPLPTFPAKHCELTLPKGVAPFHFLTNEEANVLQPNPFRL